MMGTRAVRTLAPLTLLLAAAAGCTSDGGTAAAPGSSALPASAEPSGAAPASSAAPEPSGSGGGTGGDSTRCHHGDLQIEVAPAPGGGAAGTQYSWLKFVNMTSHRCTLYGYPGVSWVTGANGQQVNRPAGRDPSAKPEHFGLDAHQPAHAQVSMPQTGNFGDADCKPVQAAGFRVYLPDETAADFVPVPMTVCSADGVGLAQIGPMISGLSE
ncbi:DUF4232 domain-containing protein [Dactylosporangium sp. McL0621]|uniref:DUF4232 domain-containing protein n=1 Tax=Dactylosporangium sp. McL0621 TaxID=3415678 RepID=UPI003CF71B64